MQMLLLKIWKNFDVTSNYCQNCGAKFDELEEREI